MARNSRLVVPGRPHHITQRGNRKQQVFFEDLDREYYLHLLSSLSPLYGVEIFAYCLMTNHTHLGLIPNSKPGLSEFMKQVHGRYSRFINKRFDWTGHLWQQRFFSSPLDQSGFKQVVGYIELNPVRARIVSSPEDYKWSSARAHLYKIQDDYVRLNDCIAEKLLSSAGKSWKELFFDSVCYEQFRKSHLRNLPIGSEAFIEKLEERSNLILRPQKRGPKRI